MERQDEAILTWRECDVINLFFKTYFVACLRGNVLDRPSWWSTAKKSLAFVPRLCRRISAKPRAINTYF